MIERVLTIGKILKPIGLLGEVKVALLTDFPERFNDLHEVMVQPKQGELFRCQVSGVRYGPPFIYLTFAGLRNASSVEFLRDAFLQLPESERVSLSEGRYFQSDLVGMDVYVRGGAVLGKITEIFETGSNDVFVVKDDCKEYLIPAIEKIVKAVDLRENRMIIEPIEGLLEL